ncbi:hypothetical protein [Qingshengfaniella alkalisoli]|uniref:Uncharacterized protein n=1 Tax=Qingshengfaniella alkalisoli TaxID=2599296 RepID=A0A5B8IXI4_9RHOB|nr:hypothetical protein [Qingshengfaniella alkalisoli]QDY69308.1 hypothetical protein FPZ52_06475 [Qingshengfaniella alkalisoli]
MTEEIINTDPDIEAAFHAGQLTKIEITAASMTLSDGVFTLNAKDILPPKIKNPADEAQPKTNKERQRAYTQRKKDAGFKKDWIHESVAILADEVGGQECIVAEIERLRTRAEMAEERAAAERLRAEAAEADVKRLKALRWWQFWL